MYVTKGNSSTLQIIDVSELPNNVSVVYDSVHYFKRLIIYLSTQNCANFVNSKLKHINQQVIQRGHILFV